MDEQTKDEILESLKPGPHDRIPDQPFVSWGMASDKAIRAAKLHGGVGDIKSLEREHITIDHKQFGGDDEPWEFEFDFTPWTLPYDDDQHRPSWVYMLWSPSPLLTREENKERFIKALTTSLEEWL